MRRRAGPTAAARSRARPRPAPGRCRVASPAQVLEIAERAKDRPRWYVQARSWYAEGGHGGPPLQPPGIGGWGFDRVSRLGRLAPDLRMGSYFCARPSPVAGGSSSGRSFAYLRARPGRG